MPEIKVSDGLPGVTVIEFRTGEITVSTAVLLVTPPKVAVMFVGSAAIVVARPLAAIVALVVSEEVQLTIAVRFCVLLSE